MWGCVLAPRSPSAGLGLDPLRNGPRRPAHVPHLRVRHPDAGLSPRVRRCLRHLPRAGLVVVPGHRRRDARLPAPHDRPRRCRRAAVRAGHPAAAAALRDQRDGADADGQLHVDARLRLRVPRDSPCGDGDRDAALAAVRQAVPRLQRPAQLGVGFYKDAGARDQQAACRRCGQPYASQPMVRDLTTVEQELGFQASCPAAATTRTSALGAAARFSVWRRGPVAAVSERP